MQTDILIFGGQSNMQGQSEELTSTDPIPRAYEFKYTENCIVPLKNPVGEDITHSHEKGFPLMEDTDFNSWLTSNLTGSSCYGNTNMVPEFCRSYSEVTSSEVLAVHIAKGSADIAMWDEGSDLYSLTVKKAAAAIKAAEKAGGADRILLVWLQGESDAIYALSKDAYKEKLSCLADELFENLPNILRKNAIRQIFYDKVIELFHASGDRYIALKYICDRCQVLKEKYSDLV